MRRLLTAAARHAGPGWVVLRRAGARRGRGDNASGSEASASARGAYGEHGQQHAVGADPAGEGGSRAAAAPALGHCSLGMASLWGRRGGAGRMLRDRTEGHRASVPRTGWVAGFGRVRRTKGATRCAAPRMHAARVWRTMRPQTATHGLAARGGLGRGMGGARRSRGVVCHAASRAWMRVWLREGCHARPQVGGAARHCGRTRARAVATASGGYSCLCVDGGCEAFSTAPLVLAVAATSHGRRAGAGAAERRTRTTGSPRHAGRTHAAAERMTARRDV